MRVIAYLLIFISSFLTAEENFLLINDATDEVVLEMGANLNEQMSPCFTFKIALSLMGFDAGILRDEKTPTWNFQHGYDEFLESWKLPQTPLSWMKTSCVWYSRVLVGQVGIESVQNYLADLEYGNQDASGGLTKFWINSSLKISPKEQVNFIRKMINTKLPLSTIAIQMTKALLFVDELPNGWKLFGKTGWSGSIEGVEMGWFVGWIEKEHRFFPFAYNIKERKINLAQRIPRVKALISESNVCYNF